MKSSPLFSNFDVTATGICPRRNNISRETFLTAFEEYLDLVRHNSFKIGDLLHEYRERFGNDVQDYLIPRIITQERQKKANLEKCMCLAKGYAHSERLPDVDQTHHWEVLSVLDTTARREILEYVRAQRKTGKDVKTSIVRRMARDAKIATGQGVRSPKKKRKNRK